MALVGLVAASAVVVVVVPAVAFSASLVLAHTADTPEPYPPESDLARALMGEEELASEKKQSRRPKKSAPQKKEKPWSALAPQYPVQIAGL